MVHLFPDGSQFIVTTQITKNPLVENSELMALHLGGPNAEWISGHSDPRGVCLFTDDLIPKIEHLSDYQSVVDVLGDGAQWIFPISIKDLMEERRQKAEEFCESRDKRKK